MAALAAIGCPLLFDRAIQYSIQQGTGEQE
jgi:hypothetical protein